MADRRSRVEKLRAMAGQSASPREAEIAGRILDEMAHEERVWGSVPDPEEIFQRFARGSSIERDAIEVFAKAFGFRVTFDLQQRPVSAEWEGDLRREKAPIAAMVRSIRRSPGRKIGEG